MHVQRYSGFYMGICMSRLSIATMGKLIIKLYMPSNSLIENIVPSECNNNVVVFFSSIWANGKMGSITDSEGNGVFRFFEMKSGKFSTDVVSEKPEDNPIVATGIVAYCLHNRTFHNILFKKLRLSSYKHKSIQKQFDDYTANLFEEYREKREQEPDSWRCNSKAEFYTNYILPHTISRNDESKALFEYLTPKDCQYIRNLMKEYVLYLETKKKEFSDDRVKPESRKADKKSFDPDTFRETFTYWPDGMSEDERNIRLKMAFSRMRGSLIDRDTHYDTFEALLSGKPLDVKIVWIGINSQLRGLFSQLVTKNKILKKPTGGLNQILTARFKKADGTLFTANEIKDAGSDGDMKAVYDVVESLTPSPVKIEDLETQLGRLLTEEQERSELRGMKDNKPQEHLPKGTNLSSKPNQHTRKNNKKS